MTSSKQNPVPLLLTYLFGESAQVACQGASPRLLLWAAAFEAWLAELLGRFKPGTVVHYRHAWRRLLTQTRKMPWELTQGDIAAHLAWLKAEDFSPESVYKAARQISSFYRWCSLHAVDPESPPGFNPAEGVSNPCPQHYSGLKLLSRGGVRRLLEALRRDEAPIAKRDYAFLLARLRLGVPTSQIQKLQWGQIKVGEAEACVRWRVGGEAVRLPEEVWEAIQRYLSASGRLATLQPGAYVFAPLGEATRELRGDQAGDWQEERAISLFMLKRRLKRYGAVAQLPKEALSLDGLRLTALRLKLDEGYTLEEIKSFMDSRSPLKLLKYRLKALPELPPDDVGQAVSLPPTNQAPPAPDDVGQPVRQAVSLSLAVEAPSHQQHIYQPGDGYKHGWYAHSQPPEQVQAVLAENIHGIEEAFAGLRRLGRGLFERHTRASSASEMARLGDAYTLTASRLGEMLRAEREMAGGKSGSQERRSQIEDTVDWLVRAEESEGRPTTRAAVLAELQAQALGGGEGLGLAALRLEEEVATMRLVLRNILDLALQAGEVAEYIYLVNIYSSGCSRLVRMLNAGQVGDEQLIHYIRGQILKAIAEVSKDWDPSA